MTTLDLDPGRPADTLVRPQPIGLFDGPAGLILVPDGDGVGSFLADLARGVVPDVWPAAATALEATWRGDTEAALAGLGSDPVSHVNRFVLAPTGPHLAAARTAAAGDPRLTAVVEAAAFASDLADTTPDDAGLDGEFAALARTIAASQALEDRDFFSAVEHLRAAVAHAAPVGTGLHGRQLAVLAAHMEQIWGPTADLVDVYEEAIQRLAPTAFDDQRAHLHLQRAMVDHQLATSDPSSRHRLLDAIRSYQSALIVLDEQTDPDSFALANMNVALAILAMPMSQASDQVRLGVAVQSLRAALRVYDREGAPHEWSACQLNLANALQYLPSRHREDNLGEAVNIYEELLEFRSPDTDPMGYARVLANQANALAHLGGFDHALAKYAQARDLFDGAGDRDAVRVAQEQIAQIGTRRAELGGETA